MTKQESLEFKGIAILLMLLLHLFNTQERVAECTTFINFWNHKTPRICTFASGFILCTPLHFFERIWALHPL